MNEARKAIYVTEPFLPPLEEFITKLAQRLGARPSQLKHVGAALAARAAIVQRYAERLDGVEGIERITIPVDTTWNYSYYPIYIKPELLISRDELYVRMKQMNIHPRRHFPPGALLAHPSCPEPGSGGRNLPDYQAMRQPLRMN